MGVAGDEDVEILFLQLARNAHCVFDGWRRAHDSGKSRSRAVNELDPALADDDIVGRAQPDAIDRVGTDKVLTGLDNLEGEQGGGARIERVAQVGQPQVFAGHRRQQPVALLENLLHVRQLVHTLAQKRVDDRQGIGGIGKADGAVGAFGRNRLCQVVFRVAHNLVSATNCRRRDDLAHCSSRLDFMSYILRSF